MNRGMLPLLALLCSAVPLTAAEPTARITIDRNQDTAATKDFHFARVPAPAADDAAAHAQLTLIAGKIDSGSSGLPALNDGVLPTDADQPQSSLFFQRGTWGGRVRFDFGAPIVVAAISSYSWHPDSRAPQLYKVYGSSGREPRLDLQPPSSVDPAAAGWNLIAFVDTRADHDEGGQYGVRIDGPDGSLGRYRYLLFDFFDTEGDDNWGNTFYSEIDVLEGKR
ncbi:MAG TPA: hypothetical protein VKH35_05835 [Thermoanaerobaculia bacterium]|jgi:hypothetical protein|nr:hypothetical protein [Thermoanaerobaculia bacterium]